MAKLASDWHLLLLKVGNYETSAKHTVFRLFCRQTRRPIKCVRYDKRLIGTPAVAPIPNF